jgi:hypothetical protein
MMLDELATHVEKFIDDCVRQEFVAPHPGDAARLEAAGLSLAEFYSEPKTAAEAPARKPRETIQDAPPPPAPEPEPEPEPEPVPTSFPDSASSQEGEHRRRKKHRQPLADPS